MPPSDFGWHWSLPRSSFRIWAGPIALPRGWQDLIKALSSHLLELDPKCTIVKSEVDGAGRLVLDLSAQANGDARAYAQFYEVASCYTCSTCGKMGARIDAVTTPYCT